ncbi:ZinT/AdcA family metal-binding protein [uncultured Ruminococcus sp.]|uniref:metal ABC transporter solute-binding protein, Zn/Mn family n=1 Tax=uncultured Ruminococcus sp. TaxID=165186 RepID=UPI0025D69A4C|nr:ZinT/AdcA family metal-binding protein [uncultured Ruminococcus sp.]
MFKKKIGIYALTFAMAAMGMTGCSSSSSSSSKTEATTQAANKAGSDPFSVVCTIFPEYDWVKEILGNHADNVELTYLLDSGIDLHNYQPTADDIMKISNCDLFVYVGGESDEWVEDALAGAANKDMKVINLMDVLGDSAKVEELKEGMQESEHEHSHEHKTDFEDSEVKDRTLSEWNGSWQSTYPLLLDGSLDEVWEYKAENDDTMTAENYKKKYTTAYETDVVTIKINAPEIEYVTADKSVKADYDYSGFYIRTKDDGSKQVRYKFEKKSGDDSAAKYIVFSDHNIEPSEPEHFHLYSGNDGFDSLVEEGTHFPTYYPSSLNAEDIVEEMTGGEKHDHDHSKEVSTFEDDEVKDRNLSDWAGEWQSPYPFVLDGTLDEAWEAMAETKGKMTAEEYKEYYKTGYETDIKSVKIDGDNITYTYDNGKTVSSDYKYTGYFIQDWSGGTRAAMYRFEAEDKNSGAPVYIEINDHMIEPAEAEHFHLRMSDESYDAIVDPEKYWPTFFPAEMSGEDICDHLAGHDKDEDEHEHEHEEGEEEYDEHVWLSLKNAKVLCAEIEKNLEAIDSANAADYKANLDSYVAKLDELDGKFKTLVDDSSVKALVFGDRFPFRYFVDDYGLDYYAAFIGCSAETEASFKTIAFLSDKIKELDCKTIFTLENSSKDIAESIINNSGKTVDIAELNSLQSISKNDIAGGVSYISLMQKNYDVLAGVLK